MILSCLASVRSRESWRKELVTILKDHLRDAFLYDNVRERTTYTKAAFLEFARCIDIHPQIDIMRDVVLESREMSPVSTRPLTTSPTTSAHYQNSPKIACIMVPPSQRKVSNYSCSWVSPASPTSQTSEITTMAT